MRKARSKSQQFTIVILHILLVSALFISGFTGPEMNELNHGSEWAQTIRSRFRNHLSADLSGIQSDDFNACNLDEGLWAVVDPVGDGQVSLNGSQLLLSVPGGQSHDVWTAGNQSLRLMQPAGDADFELEVKFDTTVEQAYQMQGLLAEQDGGNYVRVDYFHDGGGVRLFVASFVGGSPQVHLNQGLGGVGPPLYLRLGRQGASWAVSYSLDGLAWQGAVGFTHELAVGQVGVFAGNAGGNPPAHTAVVDYFFNTAQPIEPEDAQTFSFPLEIQVEGNGQVITTPAQTEFSCNQSVELQAVGEPGWGFTGWSGDLDGTTNPVQIVMSQPLTIMAHFAPDQQPPEILDVQVVPEATGATIRWQSDEPSQGWVSYGSTVDYELGELSGSAGVMMDEVVLGNLASESDYHFQVVIMDSGGNTTSTGDLVFTTLPSGTIIDLWYGDDLRFGHIGNPQRWVNVFGNVSSTEGIASLTYSLNGGSARPLSIGPDGHRLAMPGDFNIDVDLNILNIGPNQVDITATDQNGLQTVRQVNLFYEAGNVWPSPYEIHWENVASIQDAAQVVDGKWALTGSGVRTVEPDYDRMIAIGDLAWRDYEIQVPITVHHVDMAGSGGDSGEPGLGLLIRWTGHTDDPIAGWQPKTGFQPFGSIGWWRWSDQNTARLEFYGSGYWTPMTPQTGVTYIFKARVESQPPYGPVYKLKAWPQDEPEPADWNLVHQALQSNLDHGSVLLVAHHVDATFGNVSVTPLSSQVEWTLNVVTQGYGTVAVDPDQPFYTPGQQVTLTAVPDPEMNFTGWSGDFTGSQNPLTITMNQNVTIQANFGQPPPDSSGIVSDNFNSTELDEGLWAVVDPVGDGQVSLNGSQALLSVPGGQSHDVWTAGNQSLRLMQPAGDADFELEVKFDTTVEQAYQMQGLLAEQDGGNYVRVDYFHDGGGVRLFVASFVGGSPQVHLNQGLGGVGPPLYLRLGRQGASWAVSYSLDGLAWQGAVGFTHELAVGQVGVFAGNAGGNPPAHTAVVDYFFNTAQPIEP